MKNQLKYKMYLKNTILLSISLLFFSSCLITKKVLKEEEILYYGPSFKVESDTVIKSKRAVKRLMKSAVYPLPNKTLLTMPVQLWIYRMMGDPKRGIGHYIKYNYGEPPVLMTDVPMENVREGVQNMLKANGFLDAEVKAKAKDIWWTKKRKKIEYQAFVKNPYLINQITNVINDSAILDILEPKQEETLILPNEPYNLNKLKDERERIDVLLKNEGYFFFSPDYLLFFADSTVGWRKIDLTMKLRTGIDPENLKQWYINKITVREQGDSLPSDTTFIDGIAFTHMKNFKPKPLRRYILFDYGNLMLYRNFNYTNKNLASIPAFKFTNMEFYPDSTYANHLNINITIIPAQRRSITAQFNLVSKSTDFAGPGVEISHLNRNFFKGGEQLSYKLNGSIEAWLKRDANSQVLGNYNYELGASVELKIPRFQWLNPSFFSQRYIPQTIFTLQFRMVTQVKYYRTSIFRFRYGYEWRETESKRHELNLADVSFQYLMDSTAVFTQLSRENSLFRRSFEDQFIIGTNYIYQYEPKDKGQIFRIGFTGSIDLAGNTLYGLFRLINNEEYDRSRPYKILNSPFSQFSKFTLEFKSFLRVWPRNTLAFRTIAGLGFPMGNSLVLPNMKQFFVGGANSIRAFPLRTIGPGGYMPENTVNLYDQTGDIKLEANLENRFLLTRSLELALFLDAGNVWMARQDTERFMAQFNKNEFYKQIAVGWGFGIRYINQYFVLRVDIGYPLRLPNGDPMVSELGSVVNLAIGYPF